MRVSVRVSVSTTRAALIGCGLVVWLAAVCAAEASPTILMTPLSGAREPLPDSVAGLEARIAAAIETIALGRAHGILETDSATRVGFEADDIRQRATSSGAAYVVVGEWLSPASSGNGDQSLAVALTLRSGHSGATEFRYRLSFGAAAPTTAVVGVEVERLARAMLRDLQLLPGGETPASVAPVAEIVASPPATRAMSRTDFLKLSRDEPIEIVSDELEVLAVGSGRQFTFTNHVHVTHGEMQLFAGYLEALYPDGASQPERLDAYIDVRMIEGDLEVRCNEVTYLREEGLVICRGDALLLQGCDEVRGREIEFYLDEERVKVLGAASVVLRFEQEDQPNCERESTG